nr:cation diffusion facilitator family transporter [Agitococcus sp.]
MHPHQPHFKADEPHTHSHHHHSHNDYGRIFAFGIVANVVFVVLEAFYGWFAQSLALLADAGHNLSDVLGLLLAWSGFWLAQRKGSPKHTYGWRKASILAALTNSILLLVAM